MYMCGGSFRLGACMGAFALKGERGISSYWSNALTYPTLTSGY